MLALGELTVSARPRQPAMIRWQCHCFRTPLPTSGVVLLAIVPLLLATAGVAWLRHVAASACSWPCC